MKIVIEESQDLGYYEFRDLGSAFGHSLIVDVPEDLIQRRKKAVYDFESTRDELAPLVNAARDEEWARRVASGEVRMPEPEPVIYRGPDRGPRAKAREPLRRIVARP